MILFHQIRKVLMTIGLVVLLATVITFSSAPGKSLGYPFSAVSIDQPYTPIAAVNQARAMAKNAEGKVQEGIGNMTGDLKNQAAGKAKQFEANTQKAIIESIQNPDYQTDGQNLRKRDREAVECLEDDVHDCFDQQQGAD